MSADEFNEKHKIGTRFVRRYGIDIVSMVRTRSKAYVDSLGNVMVMVQGHSFGISIKELEEV